CVATALLESGTIEMVEGLQRIVLESPAGLARISARNADGRVEAITTQGEPAYVAERGLGVEVPDHGRVEFDVVWSGAYYAMIRPADHGFELTPDEQIALTAFGDAFVRAARPGLRQEHPSLGDVGPLPFVHFMGRVRTLEDGAAESRSATYVPPGVICRSPTGSGTSPPRALMAGQGGLAPRDGLAAICPRGNRCVGTVLEETMVGDLPAWNSTITGSARLMARSRVTVDLDDPLVDASDLEQLLRP